MFSCYYKNDPEIWRWNIGVNTLYTSKKSLKREWTILSVMNFHFYSDSLFEKSNDRLLVKYEYSKDWQMIQAQVDGKMLPNYRIIDEKHSSNNAHHYGGFLNPSIWSLSYGIGLPLFKQSKVYFGFLSINTEIASNTPTKSMIVYVDRSTLIKADYAFNINWTLNEKINNGKTTMYSKGDFYINSLEKDRIKFILTNKLSTELNHTFEFGIIHNLNYNFSLAEELKNTLEFIILLKYKKPK